MRCRICRRFSSKELCPRHDFLYVWDKELNGFRLKKRGRGSRYNRKKFHQSETSLVKIIESIFGKSEVFTSFYPEWALSRKNVLYEFDIFVPKFRLLIEYNGKQHYVFTPIFHKTIGAFKRQQFRDSEKRRLAENNGYKLVNFKYSEPLLKGYVHNKLKEDGLP